MSETAYAEVKSQLAEIRSEWLKQGADLDSKLSKEISSLTERLNEIEIAANRPGAGTVENKSLGQRFIEDEAVKSLKGSHVSAMVNVGTFTPKAVTSSTSYIPAMHLGPFVAPLNPTGIRGLIPNLPATSGSFDYARSTFTNNAAVQVGASPYPTENVAKAESDLSFTLVTGTIQTIAHWIAASKQSLDDMGQLQGIIDSQLLGGLRVKEESQILVGSGAGGNMNGIYTQATAKDTGLDPSSPNALDKLRMALLQVQLTNHAPSAIVLHPTDFAQIDTIKASTAGTYLVGNPQGTTTPTLWGFPVVTSLALTAGTFLVGAFATACALYDRQNATIEVTNSHSDYFTKNMIAVRAEERLGLAVMFPGAFVKGSL